MYKVDPSLKKMIHLSEKTNEDLKVRYNLLVEELKFARNAFEFERAAEIKSELLYITEELSKRKI
ncbi:hypothetical protein [Evansella cellulosilytica]|uniref:Excinuclease ABC subunit B n=1 Tax=Evansella cellulosilytica (strain ATCC 21833 / DSM 2522 / FERM P-1141 / JCM 9156 / N-4) TaxID=649639 RepID=E6TRC4_EVAC2|nr:hypothetical protein [Evansella cellulosilytica]ADU30636.1 excinuclease ABC subunit B [Evansella cellulosilytica DSM 2522]